LENATNTPQLFVYCENREIILLFIFFTPESQQTAVFGGISDDPGVFSWPGIRGHGSTWKKITILE